jgi:hypothetical protein
MQQQQYGHPKVIDRLVNRNSCYLGGKPPESDGPPSAMYAT